MIARNFDSGTQCGATMVEFSIALPVIILLIVFTIDGFIAAFRYSRLTYAVSEITRRVAVEVGIQAAEGDLCDALTARAENAGRALYQAGGALEALVRPVQDGDIQYSVVGGQPYPFVTVTAGVTTGCLFCRFLPATLLQTSSTLAIERRIAGCI